MFGGYGDVMIVISRTPAIGYFQALLGGGFFAAGDGVDVAADDFVVHVLHVILSFSGHVRILLFFQQAAENAQYVLGCLV